MRRRECDLHVNEAFEGKAERGEGSGEEEAPDEALVREGVSIHELSTRARMMGVRCG